MYSIIIPTYGIKGISMLDNLLDSISKFDNPSLNEIIISDDGSDVNTIPALINLRDRYENIFKIIPIINPEFHSFSKTVNSGMKISNPNNDILLLNNDMVALTNFEPFVYFMKEMNNNKNRTGIIGAKLLYPNLSIQHAGIVRMSLINRFRHIYKGRNYDHPPTNFKKKYISVTGACQYINRELINKIGYLDERYKLSYEDVDYCLNAQLNGYNVWYIPDVLMIHNEFGTRGSIRSRRSYDEQNRKLFWNKWNNLYDQIKMNGYIPDDDLDLNITKLSVITMLLCLGLKRF